MKLGIGLMAKLQIISMVILAIILIAGFIEIEKDLDKKIKFLTKDIVNIGKMSSDANTGNDRNEIGIAELFFAIMNDKAKTNFLKQSASFEICQKTDIEKIFISRYWQSEQDEYAQYLIIQFQNGYEVINRFTGNIVCYELVYQEKINCTQLCIDQPIIGGRNFQDEN